MDDTDSNIATVKRDRRHAHARAALLRILVILLQRINDCRVAARLFSSSEGV